MERQTTDMLIDMGKRISQIEDQLEKVNEMLRLATDALRRKDSEIELLRSQLAYDDFGNSPSDMDLTNQESSIIGLSNGTTTNAEKQRTIPVIKLPKYIPKNSIQNKNSKDVTTSKSAFFNEFEIHNGGYRSKSQHRFKANVNDRPPSIGSDESISDILQEELHSLKDTNSAEIPRVQEFEEETTNVQKNVAGGNTQNLKNRKLQDININVDAVTKKYLPQQNSLNRAETEQGTVLTDEKYSELICKSVNEFNEYLDERKQAEIGSTAPFEEAMDDVFHELNDSCKKVVHRFTKLKARMEASSLNNSSSTSSETVHYPKDMESTDLVNLGKLIVVITELNDQVSSETVDNEMEMNINNNEEELVPLALYADGLQIQGRPFRRYASPSVEEFFHSLNAGYYPTEQKGAKRTVYKILDYRKKRYINNSKRMMKSTNSKK